MCCASLRETVISPKDPLQLLSEAREEPLHSATEFLFHRSLMNRTQVRRNLIAVLEVLDIDRTGVDGLQIRHLAQLDFL